MNARRKRRSFFVKMPCFEAKSIVRLVTLSDSHRSSIREVSRWESVADL
ncbi:MAG: hypothetical protein Hyperionvirus23_20 [Hyperionvirus sp.]|uniref:Uncharacterized protein n=1 Tax=Hyperionvirus sp. TaxID=2487770 RepID=A0A3G5AEP4_9VIRU|nr:MAG: hypothetical protein Hyperionvirus23_20 [Hyperionvirus sp.]